MKRKDTDINSLKNVSVSALAPYGVTVWGDCQPSLDSFPGAHGWTQINPSGLLWLLLGLTSSIYSVESFRVCLLPRTYWFLYWAWIAPLPLLRERKATAQRMPHPSGLGLLVMLRCFQEVCKGCVQLPECTRTEAMWRRIWLPECTRAEAMWRRIRLPECTRADAMWRRIIGSSASWELVAGRVQLRSRCGFSDVPGVVARSWVSLLGPQLVLLISAL